MKGIDGILVLLQDIKAILYGIALLIMGGILVVAGILLNTGLGFLLLCIGIIVCITGLIRAYRSHSHHEVVETKGQ